MASATEIPDFVGAVTQALGLNRLWQTEEQADADKRKNERHGVGESAEDEARRTKQTEDEDTGDVAPVSIAKERQKEEETVRQGQGRVEGIADHDMDLDVVSSQAPPEPSAGKGKGYEWPMPASMKDNQAKKKYDTAPTQNDFDHTTLDQPQEKSQSQPIPDVDMKPTKAAFKGALLPFLSQQRASTSTSALPTSAQSAPLNKENPFEQPRPQSSSSAQKVDRPKQQRQFTMPANGRLASGEAKDKSAARSRWQIATHNLRFPLRRRKTDRKEAAIRGAEVVTTLAAGAPAAILLASHMVSDERSHHRIPIIVDLLKVPTLWWLVLIIDLDHRFGTRAARTYLVSYRYDLWRRPNTNEMDYSSRTSRFSGSA